MEMHKTAGAVFALSAALATWGQQSHANEAMDAKAYVKEISSKLGIELWGYGRGGFYPKNDKQSTGGYTLGGHFQKFRLGNEGDNYLEFGIGKTLDIGGGVRWGVKIMPYWYEGEMGLKQGYVEATGMDFLPSATFWAGQRYHRLQDIHILDRWVMQDGDNYGAGIDAIDIGLGRLNVATYTSGSFRTQKDSADTTIYDANPNNARRFNFQWYDIPVNPGGKLTLTGATVSGDFAQGKNGNAWGLRHNQVISKEINNTLFLQTSSGHADIDGRFYGLDTKNTVQQLSVTGPGIYALDSVTTTTISAGAKQNAIADAINWQVGRFGGQAVVAYATKTPDGTDEIRDFSVGGRASYAIAARTKLLLDMGWTSRETGAVKQTLNKETLAVAFSPDGNFWTRPEFRIYVTRANWNQAAADANAASFGKNGRKSDMIAGMQVEAWW